MGESDKDKAAQEYYNSVKGANTNVANRFSGYQDPYSVSDILTAYNKYYDQGIANLAGNAQNQISSGVQNNTARLASQGITGGGMLNNSNNALVTGIGNNTTNALRQMQSEKAGGVPGILNQGNQNQFRTTQAAQNVDLANVGNLLAKYGVQGGAINGLKDTTWLDDALGIANTLANLGASAAKFF